MTSVVVLTGGPEYAHDFVASSAAIAQVLRCDGHTVAVVDHPDAVAEVLAAAQVLVVNALWWRMLGERYDHLRDTWGYHTSDATRHAIESFVRAGGGLVGSHTASICFDDWPEWGDVLGGAWQWGCSSHPAAGPVHAEVTEGASGHPVMNGVPVLDLVDEVYGDQSLRPATRVLMTARRTPDDRDQPVVWAASYGAGRVVYDGFGHDAASLLDAQHQRLLRNAVRWVIEP